MTGTKVTKAAGLFLDVVGAGTVSSVSSSADDSFSQVMNRTKQDLGENLADVKHENAATAKAPVKVEKSSEKKTAWEKSAESEQEVATSDMSQAEKEVVDEATEQAVTEAAEEIAAAVKEELGLTDEELTAIMETLGLTQMDLLRPETMQAIVVAATGEADRLSILTDENLYQSLQMLTNAVEETVADLQEQLQVGDAALEDILKQMEVSAEPEILESAMLSENKNPVLIVEQSEGQVSMQETEAEAVNAEETAEGTAEEIANIKQTKQQGNELTTTREEKTKDEDGREAGSSDTKKEAGNDGYQNNNSLLQGTTKTGTEAWNPDNVQNEAEIPYQQADVENIMNQITEYIKIETGTELTEMEMQLQPETLGTLRIHLTAKEGVVTAQFTAENETVKAVLEAQTIQLKENLNNQGIKVEAVEVTIANQGFERSFAQNGEQSEKYEEPKKKGIRKIQLSGELSLDEMELSEEDRLAAEMMEMNGNTVDYMA